ADALDRSFPDALASGRALVFGGSNDKDITGMFRVLAPAFSRAFLTQFLHNLRAVPPEALRELWQAAGGGPAEVCATPAEALAAARAAAGPEGLVCVTGSVYLAGGVRAMLVGLSPPR